MTDKKIALITGANKGIGLETARQLGATGYIVLVGARDTERGQAAAEAMTAEDIDARFVKLDVTSQATIDSAVKWVSETFGRLDVLVNNAGVGTFQTPTSEETLDTWRSTYETNVFGLVATTLTFLPLLKLSKAGRIVNLSSVLGSLGMSSDPQSPIASVVGNGAAYASSKVAVNMFTVHLAKELAGTGIKVNSAHPGWVRTDLGGEEAPMEVEQGAKTSVYLATLPEDGPSGGSFHFLKSLPW